MGFLSKSIACKWHAFQKGDYTFNLLVKSVPVEPEELDQFRWLNIIEQSITNQLNNAFFFIQIEHTTMYWIAIQAFARKTTNHSHCHTLKQKQNVLCSAHLCLYYKNEINIDCVAKWWWYRSATVLFVKSEAKWIYVISQLNG